MARIRTIKPEFPQSESVGRMSREARLLFILLWTICDDEGRARAQSRMLASLLFPYDEDAAERIPVWLDELQREDCIKVYSVDGNSYLQVLKWTDHQKIDRPSASKFPPIPSKAKPRARAWIDRETLASPREDNRDTREPSCEDQGPRTKEGTKEGIKDIPIANAIGGAISLPAKPLKPDVDEFETWYQAMPRREARGDAEKAYRSARKSGATADELLAGAKRYAAARNGEDAQFTKTPGPWLRAKKWLDESPKPNGANGHSVPFEPADLHGWRNRIAAFAEGISAGAEPHKCWPPRWGPADGSRVPVELRGEFERAKQSGSVIT